MAMITFSEALMTLHGTGPVLETAREVSQILRAEKIEGGVIGGVAVGLHGHIRATLDVDIFVASDARKLAKALETNGFVFDHDQTQFVKRGVVVQLVTIHEVGRAPKRYSDIDGIRTVSLADLINMKLRSGRSSLVRAQDLADVVNLVRRHRLGGAFTPRIDKDLRADFRELVRALKRELN